MSLSILQSSRSPLYLQVAEILRQRIRKGVWRKDETLPSLNDLMEEFSVAKVTVRQAVKLLEEEGLLSARRGKGTIVTAEPSGRRPLKVETTLQDIVEMYSGDIPDVKNLEDGEQMPPGVIEDGVLADGYYHLKRTHTREGVTYCVISLYIELSVFRESELRFRNELAIPVLFSHPKVKIARARQNMVISKCDMETAQLIDIPLGDPVAEVCRIFFDENDRIVYLANVTYRGDYIRLDMDLRP